MSTALAIRQLAKSHDLKVDGRFGTLFTVKGLSAFWPAIPSDIGKAVGDNDLQVEWLDNDTVGVWGNLQAPAQEHQRP